MKFTNKIVILRAKPEGSLMNISYINVTHIRERFFATAQNDNL